MGAFPRPRAWPLLFLAWAVPATALAWPVDVRQVLPVGAQREIPLTALSWAETDRPEQVTVTTEVLAQEVGVMEGPPGRPTGQPPQAGATLGLSARSKGEASVLLYAEGNFAVWRLSVGAGARPPPPASKLLEGAQAACPGIEVAPQRASGHFSLKARVDGADCGEALRALLKEPAFVARDVSLEFTGEALQRQLSELEAAYAEAGLPVRASYVGAGLTLSGTVSPAQHRRALWITFDRTIGKVALTDQLRLRGAEDDEPFAAPGTVPVVPQRPAPPPRPRGPRAPEGRAP